MKNILVPTDFSQEAGYALDFGIQLAKQSGGKLHLLNVVEIPVSAAADPMGAPIVHDWGADFIKSVSASNTEKTEDIVSKYSDQCDIISKVDVGIMLDLTMGYVDEHNIDQIVMGTKGATGLKEIFIGSNAEKVVRFSPCPVITIANPSPLKDIEDMAFGLDIEGDQSKIVPQLKAIQRALNLRIHFVYVNTPHVIVNDDEVIEKMRRFALENDFENYTVNLRRNTLTYSGVIEFAKEMSADLIAMSTHSRKGLIHFFSGSLAEDVVNRSPLPVWTVSLK